MLGLSHDLNAMSITFRRLGGHYASMLLGLLGRA